MRHSAKHIPRVRTPCPYAHAGHRAEFSFLLFHFVSILSPANQFTRTSRIFTRTCNFNMYESSEVRCSQSQTHTESLHLFVVMSLEQGAPMQLHCYFPLLLFVSQTLSVRNGLSSTDSSLAGGVFHTQYHLVWGNSGDSAA